MYGRLLQVSIGAPNYFCVDNLWKIVALRPALPYLGGMFGYSVVPTRVLDALLARNRELEAREAAAAAAALTARFTPPAIPAAPAFTKPRAARRAPSEVAGAVYAPPLAPSLKAPATLTPAATPAAPALPDDLRAVCERFAWTPEELAANLAHATRLHAQGASPGVITRAIEKGADVDALFVG